MRTAVVGANGFLGKVIIDNLIAENHKVLAVYNNNKDFIPENIQTISVNNFLKGKEKIDSIVFAAGSFKNSIQENITLNNKVLFELTFLYKECRFLYVSSANVYGATEKIIKEKSPFYNPGSYGLSKLSGEYIVSSLASYSIVRLVYLYGKGLDNNSFLPVILKKGKEHGKIPIYGKGSREQDYLHVQDASKLCIAALMHNKNHIYLGATGKSVSNLEIANNICSLLPDCSGLELISSENEGTSFYYDPTWTMKELKWRPSIDIEEGLREMVL